MSSDPTDLMTPRILVVDDERQIHASLKLRLSGDYDLVFCFSAREALEKIVHERFDLCLVDIHMPQMDGLAFIDAARRVDPELGYVVLSAFDSGENLRRTIPLRVYDFISKPLPERSGFETRIPSWVVQTRQKRREHHLATQADAIANDRDSAQMEREIEFVASETARDALLQATNLLTTIQAHIVAASSLIGTRSKTDTSLAHLQRNLAEARRAVDAAVVSAQGFFDSAYANRDSSPALFNEGMRDAINIASRVSRAGDTNKVADFTPLDAHGSIRELSGIDFLLMMVPALAAALILTESNTTVRIRGEYCPRLDLIVKDSRFKSLLWLNRRNVPGSRAGTVVVIRASSPPLAREQMEAWLKGEYPPLSALAQRGLMAGIKKCRGLFGFAVAPLADKFELVLALPV